MLKITSIDYFMTRVIFPLLYAFSRYKFFLFFIFFSALVSPSSPSTTSISLTHSFPPFISHGLELWYPEWMLIFYLLLNNFSLLIFIFFFIHFVALSWAEPCFNISLLSIIYIYTYLFCIFDFWILLLFFGGFFELPGTTILKI